MTAILYMNTFYLQNTYGTDGDCNTVHEYFLLQNSHGDYNTVRKNFPITLYTW